MNREGVRVKKVSVIVPVYNVEEYLGKCLDSLVNQTLDDIEIIVVNDGSPDNSQGIIDDYVSKYPNIIKCYIKKNGGLSDARNYGIKRAKGEYIGFLDGDDYADITMFEKMYNKAISNDFDVVACDVNCVNEKSSTYISSLVPNDLIDKNDIKKQMTNIYPTAWNKIYKKTLFHHGVMFKKNVWYEDVEFLYKIFPYINKLGTIKEPLINYVQREGAITKVFDERLYHYIDNWNGIIDYYKGKGFYDEYFNELEYCYVRYLYMTFIKQATNFDKKSFNRASKLACKNVREKFPKYRHNKYFYKSLKGFYMLSFCCVSRNIIYYLYNF